MKGMYFLLLNENIQVLKAYEESLKDIINRNRRAYLNELVYRKILENYDTNYVRERQSFESDRIGLIETIVDTQIRRFEDDRRDRENINSNYINADRNRDNYLIITI